MMPAEPNAPPSMLNCTVPVGLDPVTVAVKLTDWPYVDGSRLETTPVLELTWFTTCPPLNVPVPPLWLLSPE